MPLSVTSQLSPVPIARVAHSGISDSFGAMCRLRPPPSCVSVTLSREALCALTGDVSLTAAVSHDDDDDDDRRWPLGRGV
jgi:hypothetical protein